MSNQLLNEAVKQKTIEVTRDGSEISISKDKNFNTFIKEIEKSPRIVAAFEQYIQQDTRNRIVIGEGGTITSGEKGILLPKEVFRQISDDPILKEKLVLGAAHELGHRNNPRGHTPTADAANPIEAKARVLEKEGVAITQEYLVARELRSFKRAQGIENPSVNTWTPYIMWRYDELANQYDVNSEEFKEHGIKLGAEITAPLNPSGMSKLTYAELGEFQWIYVRLPNIEHDVNPYNPNVPLNQIANTVVDLHSIQRKDFSYQTNEKGETVFAAAIPVAFFNQKGEEYSEQHNYVGHTDSLGKVTDIQHLPYNPQFSPEQAVKDYQNQSLGTVNIAPPTNSYASAQRSPAIQALHDKIGSFLYPTLEKSNVSQNHADSMVATAVQEAVSKKITADEVLHAGVDKTKNLIGVFTKEVYKVAAFDAVEASKNDPEKTLAAAQQQLEQQPMQEQQRQQQMEQQTKERSGQSMGM